MQNSRLRYRLALSVASLFAGCITEVHETPSIEDEASEPGEWRLVERDYPYALGDGAISCTDWQLVAASGEVLGLDREWYPIANMNRRLDLVDGGEGSQVDVELRDALAARGIERIESCSDARSYVQLRRELRTPVPADELERPERLGPLPPIEPGLEDALVDKIMNGVPLDFNSTVGITVGEQLCTGVLIGPFALLTAAHCVPPAPGFYTVRAWIQREGGSSTCISHAGTTCPDGTPANSYVQPHPDYDGGEEADQAVVIINPGWRAPANASTRWVRFAGDVGLARYAAGGHEPVRIAGYGRNSESGGSGVGRQGKTAQFIDWVFGSGVGLFAIPRLDSSFSAACRGDSGGGVYNTSLGMTLVLGIHDGIDNNPDNRACTPVGSNMIYSAPDGAWISNLVNFFGGSCTTFSHLLSGDPYVKCWQ